MVEEEERHTKDREKAVLVGEGGVLALLRGCAFLNSRCLFLSLKTEYVVGCTTLRVSPNMDYGLWGRILCQSKLMDYNQCTTLVQNVGMRIVDGAVRVGETRGL